MLKNFQTQLAKLDQTAHSAGQFHSLGALPPAGNAFWLADWLNYWWIRLPAEFDAATGGATLAVTKDPLTAGLLVMVRGSAAAGPLIGAGSVLIAVATVAFAVTVWRAPKKKRAVSSGVVIASQIASGVALMAMR